MQSYFIQRIGQYLSKHGRRLTGWDEILEGGLPPNAAMMSWPGTKGGIAAAKSGHNVVMTPTQYTGGSHRLDIQNTEVLINGKSVAKDMHWATIGAM